MQASGFRKGDILLPTIKVPRGNWLQGLFHAAVVWDEVYHGSGNFSGIMLTHSGRYENNIAMKETHFETGYAFGFHNTHFINQLFIKFEEWGPFKKVGRLTDEGIKFIEKKPY